MKQKYLLLLLLFAYIVYADDDINVFEIDMALNIAPSTIHFPAANEKIFSDMVTNIFSSMVPVSNTINTKCFFDFTTNGMNNDSLVKMGLTSIRTPNIFCAVAVVIPNEKDLYLTYKTLTDAIVQRKSYTSILVSLRNATGIAFDIDVTKTSIIKMVLSAPCRGPSLKTPATLAPGDENSCAQNGTNPTDGGSVSSFRMLIVVKKEMVTELSVLTMVCTSAQIPTEKCSKYINVIRYLNSVDTYVVYVTGQEDPIRKIAFIVGSIRATHDFVSSIMLLRDDITNATVGEYLYDETLEKDIITSSSIKCSISDYLWLVSLLIIFPCGYIVVWTAYRCGRNQGKRKKREQLSKLDEQEQKQTIVQQQQQQLPAAVGTEQQQQQQQQQEEMFAAMTPEQQAEYQQQWAAWMQQMQQPQPPDEDTGAATTAAADGMMTQEEEALQQQQQEEMFAAMTPEQQEEYQQQWAAWQEQQQQQQQMEQQEEE